MTQLQERLTTWELSALIRAVKWLIITGECVRYPNIRSDIDIYTTTEKTLERYHEDLSSGLNKTEALNKMAQGFAKKYGAPYLRTEKTRKIRPRKSH